MLAKKNENQYDELVRTSWYYYEWGMTQEEISQKLGISRAKVQRSLSEARKQGLVKTVIDAPKGLILETEDKLVENFPLTDAIVVPEISVQAENYDQLQDSLGLAAAGLLKRFLTKGEIQEILAIGWGTTLTPIPKHLPHQSSKESLKVVAALGHMTSGNSGLNPYGAVSEMANKLSADYHNILCPAIVTTQEKAKQFKTQRQIRKPLQMAKKADVVIISVGRFVKDNPLFSLRSTRHKNFEQLQSKGAVGDILVNFFNPYGEILESEISQRAIGLKPDDLEEPTVVAVSGGKRKIAAIKGALRTGLIDIIITDEKVGNNLIDKI